MSSEHRIWRTYYYEEEAPHNIVEDTKTGEDMLATEDGEWMEYTGDRSMYRCECGQKFRKEERAIDHLKDEGAYEENKL